MAKWGWDRLGAAGGIVFVVLLIVVQAALPSQPDLGDSSEKVTMFYLHHHRAGLIGGILIGLALVAFVWFLGSLTAAIREAGEGRLAAIAFGGGLLAIGMAMVGTVITTALAFRIALDSPDMVKGLFDMQFIALTLIGFPVAVLVEATAVAALRTRILPQWYGWTGTLAALALLFSGGALAHKGFYAPDGAYGLITLFVFLVWMLATSILLILRAPAAEPVRAPAAAAM